MKNNTILNQIETKWESSGGHCGVYMQNFEGDVSEVKKELNRLLKLGIIKSRKGIHGRLAILNKKFIQGKALKT